MERVLEANKTALSSLIDQVRRRGIVPFIGAGMSAPFYPLWSRFLLDQAKDQRILTKIRDLLRRDQYEQAAESLLGRLKEHRFHDIVRNTFGPMKLPQRNDVPDALRHVAALGQGPVLTLNFDPMLEFVFREFGAVFEREVWGAEVDTFNEALDLNLHYLLKVHGHYADRTNRVLTSSDYERRYGSDGNNVAPQDPVLPRLLERIAIGGRLLFLGCSLNQDRWVDFLKDAHDRYRHTVGWAVLQRPARANACVARQHFLSARGITPIWYDEGAHECVGIILKHVAAETARLRPPSRDGWGEIADRMGSLLAEASSPLAGRDASLALLDQYVTTDVRKPLIVSAPAGFGKTALLARWLAKQRNNRHPLACHFFSERHGLTSVADAYLNLLRQIDELSEAVKARKRGSPETELRSELYEAIRSRSDGADRLTILIDALDECEAPFDPPFSLPLPRGIRVIVSARGDKEEVEERLRNWTRDYEPLVLSALPRHVIQDWLHTAGSGELAKLSADEAFVDRLWERTEGFPLYLKHLFEEMVRVARAGGDVYAGFVGAPRGFSDYVTDQVRKLKSSDTLGVHRNQMVLAVLAVAVAPLPEQDLAAVITGTSILDLQRLPWTLSRWFSVRSDDDGTLLYALAHPLLAHEFRGVLRSLAADAERLLLDHCSRWQAHGSSYALRYYPAQLYEARRREELFAVARDTAFEQAQHHFASEEPDLPLKTVQLALRGAAQIGNTALMAEFLLLHVSRRARLLAESPLVALRHGDRKAACRLADLHGIEICTLWRLLLAREAWAARQSVDAREILIELSGKKLSRLSFWKERYAAAILGELIDLDTIQCVDLQKTLLGEDGRALLCQQLIQRSAFDTARIIAEDFYVSQERSWVLFGQAWVESAIALKHANEREFEQALRSLDATLALASRSQPAPAGIDGMTLRSRFTDLGVKTINGIAAAQACTGDVEAARQTLDRVRNIEYRIAGQCGIAAALHRSGDQQTAQAFLYEAAASTESLPPGWLLDSALVALSEAQAILGRFAEAMEAAKKIQDDNAQWRALAVIAGVHAQAGDLASARRIADQTDDSEARMEVLKTIAGGVANAGDFASALAIADEITIERIHDAVLGEIAGMQAEGGKFEEAFATIGRMRRTWLHETEDGLLRIASAQARSGDGNQARSTISKAIFGSSDYRLDWATNDVDDLFYEAAVAQARSGDWSGAAATAQKIAGAAKQARAFIAIAREEFRAYRRELAQGSVESAIKAAGKAGKLEHDVLCGIAHAQAEAGEFEPALHTMRGVSDPYSLSRGLRQIAVEATLAGHHDRANQILADARHAVTKVENIREAASYDIVLGYLKAKNFAAAMEVTAEIGSMAIAAAADDEKFTNQVSAINNQAAALREIVAALVQTGRREEARAAILRVEQTLNELRKMKFMGLLHAEQHTLETIAACQAMVGDLGAAYQTVTRVGGVGSHALSKARALKDIAEAQILHGDREAARATFASALQAAQGYQKAKSNTFECEKTIGEIAVSFAQMGELETAQEAVDCISEAERKAPTLSEIAGVLAGKGEKEASAFFAKAAACAETIQDSYRRSTTIADIAIEQARLGLGEAAVRTTARILTSRTSLLPRIAQTLFDAKDIPHFKDLLPPCSYDAKSALAICGLLIRLDPLNAVAITELVDRTSMRAATAP